MKKIFFLETVLQTSLFKILVNTKYYFMKTTGKKLTTVGI